MSKSKFNPLTKGQILWHEHMNEVMNNLSEELQYGKNAISLINHKSSHVDTSGLVKASIPDIKIKGRTLANLMGNRGDAIYGQGNQFTLTNCTMEVYNVSQSDFRYKMTIDSGVIGIMSTDTITEVNRLLKKDCYYIAIADVVPNRASDISLVLNDAVNVANGQINTGGSNEVVYTVAKIAGTSAYLNIRVTNATSGHTINTYVGKIRIYKITEQEANDIANGLINVVEVYPYVDNVKSVINPYITATENLLAYTNYCVGGIHAGGTLQGNTGSADIVSTENISLKPNTQYTLSLENNSDIDLLTDISIYARVSNKNDVNYTLEDMNLMISDFVTFSTQIEKKDNVFRVYIWFNGQNDDEKWELSDVIMEALRNGSIKFVLTETDTPVKSDMCHDSRIVFDTTLHNDEMLYPLVNGQYVKKNEWNEVELTPNHEFFIHRFSDEYIVIVFTDIIYGINSIREDNMNKNSLYLVKYDGTIIPYADNDDEWSNYYENFAFGYKLDETSSYHYLSIKIPNELSGWGDMYMPTDDEVRAFLLGWKMYAAKTKSDRNEWSDSLDETYTKGWLRLWCGIGEYGVLQNKTPFIGGSNKYTCPTINDLNVHGFKPYKVIYKRLTTSIDIVDHVGVLAVSDKTNVKVQSGLVLNERYHISYNGETTNLSHFNQGYAVLANLPKYRVGDIVKLLYNEKILPYTLYLGFGQSAEYTIENGLSEAVIGENLLNEDIFASYRIYPNDVVSSYDVTLDTAETTHDDIKKLIGKTSDLMEKLNRTKNELEFINYKHDDNIYHPNLLINGDFQVWQRGESFDRDFSKNNSLTYIADRWHIYKTFASTELTNMLVSRTEDGIKLVIKGSGQARLVQTLECPKVLWGKDVTFSAKCDKQVELIVGFRDDVQPTYSAGFNMGSKNHLSLV